VLCFSGRPPPASGRILPGSAWRASTDRRARR
jgi:hypothetical protein